MMKEIQILDKWWIDLIVTSSNKSTENSQVWEVGNEITRL